MCFPSIFILKRHQRAPASSCLGLFGFLFGLTIAPYRLTVRSAGHKIINLFNFYVFVVYNFVYLFS